MKKLISIFLALALLFGSMTAAVYADTVLFMKKDGIFMVSIPEELGEGIVDYQVYTKLAPDALQLAEGKSVVDSSTIQVYEDGVKIRITYTPSVPHNGSFYLVYATDNGGSIPGSSDTVYFGQETMTDGQLSAMVYPVSLSDDKNYSVYLKGLNDEDSQAIIKVLEFKYYQPSKLSDNDITLDAVNISPSAVTVDGGSAKAAVASASSLWGSDITSKVQWSVSPEGKGVSVSGSGSVTIEADAEGGAYTLTASPVEGKTLGSDKSTVLTVSVDNTSGDSGNTGGTGGAGSSGGFEPAEEATDPSVVDPMAEAVEIDYVAYAREHFTDISADDWFAAATGFSAFKGFFSGYPDGSFGGMNTMTMAELVALLYNISGIEEDIIEGQWYATQQAWAERNKLIEEFVPDGAVTREDFITMFVKTLSLGGTDITVTQEMLDKLSQAVDFDEIEGKNIGAIAWAVHAGLISGTSTSTLTITPAFEINRATAAAMIMNYYTKLLQKLVSE